MSEASFASLNPALLARKGGAKPAMRPQLGPIPDGNLEKMSADRLEDLGWNDMGHDHDDHTTATILQLDIPKPANEPVGSDNLLKTKQDCKETKVRPVSTSGRRAAFTLRLDPERHLKLRLASTMQNCSAQQLVTEALDALLDDFEELESLAAKLRRN